MIKRTTIPITGDSWGGSTVLEITTLQVLGRSFTNLRQAVRDADYFAQEDIRIPRYYSEYDCTGRVSTSSLTPIERRYVKDDDGGVLYNVYRHDLTMDI